MKCEKLGGNNCLKGRAADGSRSKIERGQEAGRDLVSLGGAGPIIGRNIGGLFYSNPKRFEELNRLTVRQVLSFARGVEDRHMEVQVRHVIKDVQKIATDTFLKEIRVRSIISRAIWTIKGDPTQVHQVLLNLCVNARDAMWFTWRAHFHMRREIEGGGSQCL